MFDLAKYQDIYVSEVEDHLQKLDDGVLELEKLVKQKKPQKELLNELMRSSHTIKSSSATMRYNKTAFLTHVMEDVFDYARNGVFPLTPKIINLLFKAVDALKKSLANIKNKSAEIDLTAITRQLKEITGVNTAGTGKSPRNTKGKPITNQRKVIHSTHSINSVQASSGQASEKRKTKIQIEKLEKPQESVSNQPSTAAEVEMQKISHIKVPVERLDQMMDLMEELMLDKMRLEELNRQLLQEDETTIKKESFSNLKIQLSAITEHLNRLTSDTQYQITQMRLVPLENVFTPFPRMVRDLAQKAKKEISLEISGNEIELDRTIIDKLGEPLLHLLRNVIDHGISERGEIRLTASREKNEIKIIVEDDGVGIDWNKVKQAAVEKNIVKPQEIASDNEEQITDLLFHPGLSTKKEVSETSGRGIGLSIVKNFISQIRGRVKVESPLSEKGGTRFTLELPQLLAIINVLLVKVENLVFALPFSSIEKTVAVAKDDIKTIADQETAVINQTDIPIVRLEKVFDLKILLHTTSEVKARLPLRGTSGQEVPLLGGDPKMGKSRKEVVVIVKSAKETIGCVVGKLIGKENLTVKPLPNILRDTKSFSGSAILGDGRTILIIDIPSLIKNVQ